MKSRGMRVTPAALNAAMARAMSEDELLEGICEAATLLGWRWTHLGGDQRGVYRGHKGLPDLVLVRRGRVLFLELKSMTGELSVDQLAWLQAIDPAGAPWRLDPLALAEVQGLTRAAFLIYPSDYDAVLELLK